MSLKQIEYTEDSLGVPYRGQRHVRVTLPVCVRHEWLVDPLRQYAIGIGVEVLVYL